MPKRQAAKTNTPAEKVSFANRLKYGFISIAELGALHGCGRTKIYEDIKAGVLKVEKHGGSTRIAGPIAKAYRPGARRPANAGAAR